MNRVSKAVVIAGAGAGAGVSAVWMWGSRRRPKGPDGRPDRWLAVTVFKPPEEVGDLPQPLADLGDAIEVRIQPAPGGKGTEIAARPRQAVPSGLAARMSGDDPRQDVRRALRAAKSLLETGEVLRADPRPSTHPGPAGKLLQVLTRRAGGEGRL